MDTAIILAAGMGLRMRPLTKTLPKPLICVNNTPMIETVIDGLNRERQMKKIFVITGYLYEKFWYLEKKYKNVEIIINHEYQEKNNISSLYAARDVLGISDCFICEADLLLKDSSVLRRNFIESGYLGKMVVGYSDDWVFERENGYITHIGKGGKDAYNMAGIAYFTKKDAVCLKEKILEAYKKQGHETLFWDEVAGSNLKELKLRVYPVERDQIIEIDTIKELEKWK